LSGENEIHLGDIGTVFRQLVTDCGSLVDLTTATSLSICFTRPDLTTETVAATLTNALSPAYMQYTVASSAFLDQADDWQWQGHIVFGPTQEWRTNIKSFVVYRNLCLL
jgi:hypothetical protein